MCQGLVGLVDIEDEWRVMMDVRRHDLLDEKSH